MENTFREEVKVGETYLEKFYAYKSMLNIHERLNYNSRCADGNVCLTSGIVKLGNKETYKMVMNLKPTKGHCSLQETVIENGEMKFVTYITEDEGINWKQLNGE